MKNKYIYLEDATFIATIFNERESLLDFLQSLFAQSAMVSQIVIVDGGSTDGTVDLLKKFFIEDIPMGIVHTSTKETGPAALKEIVHASYAIGDGGMRLDVEVYQKDGANISQGRNIAFSKARHPYIFVSDAGCVLDKDWLLHLSAQIIGVQDVGAAGGFSMPVSRTFLEDMLASCIMPELKEIKKEKFMPSSRSLAIRKDVFMDAGMYPEDMSHGEDMKLNFNIRQKGYKIAFSPDAIVYWRMRSGFRQIFQQFFRYAKGDAIGGMYKIRHAIRFASMAVLALIILLSVFIHPAVSLSAVALFLGYMVNPIIRIVHRVRKGRLSFLYGLSLVIPCFFLMMFIDKAKVFGYLYGLSKRNHKYNISMKLNLLYKFIYIC
jgi:glycosyltransferase involved in cell wall biosynthesis